MKHPLLKYLCCPQCKSALTIKSKSLTCRTCKKKYSIIHGIPILIDLSTLPSHLQQQVQYFEKEDISRKTYILEAWQKRYVDNFLATIQYKKDSLIIDNATGSGYMAIELAKCGFNVVAMDLTLKELMKLRTFIKVMHLDKKILLVCASSEDLPIKTNVAHGMVANAILEHLPNENTAIKEIGRVLKKKATLMLAMPIQLQYVWPFLWYFNIRHDRSIGHLRRYSRKDILEKFHAFCELQTYYTGSLGKVFCILGKIVTKDARWDIWGEYIDAYFAHVPYGASNVVCILQKQ